VAEGEAANGHGSWDIPRGWEPLSVDFLGCPKMAVMCAMDVSQLNATKGGGEGVKARLVLGMYQDGGGRDGN